MGVLLSREAKLNAVSKNDHDVERIQTRVLIRLRSVWMCVLCVTGAMNVIILLCQNRPMGEVNVFFCLQYVLIFFESVCVLHENH